LLASAAAADDPAPEPDPLLAAIRTAVASGHITNTRVLGFHDSRRPYNEMSQAGVLVGFDLGVGKFFNIETVYALRAIYRTAHGERYLQDHGLFTSQPGPGNRLIKTRVLRTVRVKARSGFAVGGLTVRSGLNLNGLSVTFMRINGTRLEPQHAYTSEWVGDRTGGGEAYIGSNGEPVVGLMGSQDQDHIMSVGLIFANTPIMTAKRRPEPPRDEKPAQPPADPPKVEHPVAAANPPPQPDPPVVPVPADPAKASSKEPPKPAADRSWISLVIFGAVAAPVFLLLLVSFGRKRQVQDRETEKDHPAPKRRAGPPPVPPSANTAIRERSPRGRQPGSPPVEEEVPIALLEDEEVPIALLDDEEVPQVLPVKPEVRPQGNNPVAPPAPPSATAASGELPNLGLEPVRRPVAEDIPVVLPARPKPPSEDRADKPIVPPAEDIPFAVPLPTESEKLLAPDLPRAADIQRTRSRTPSEELAAFHPPPEVVVLGPPDRVFTQTTVLKATWAQLGPGASALVPNPEWLALGLGVGVAVAGLLLLLAIAVVPWDAKKYFFLIGMAALVFGGALIALAWQTWIHKPKYSYALYPQALVCVQNGTWTIVTWDEVAEFRGHYNWGSRASLVKRDGRELRLGEHILFPGRLYKEVERRLFPLLLRRAVEALDVGKRVWFGPIGVSRRGLTYKGKDIEWHEIDRIDLASPNGAGGTGGAIGGLVGAMGALHIHLLIAKRGDPAGLLSHWNRWCDELFPVLPNRAVLLKLLHTLRPPTVSMTVSKALGVFMPPLF
jgi:hypothetical protein